MFSLKKIEIIGNLTRDPELKEFGNDRLVLNFSVAVNDSVRDPNDNTKYLKTVDYFNVTVWGKRANTLNRFLKKGTTVYVNGKLTADNYVGKDGKNKTSLKIMANDVILCNSSQREYPNPDGWEHMKEIPKHIGKDKPTQDSFDDDIPF